MKWVSLLSLAIISLMLLPALQTGAQTSNTWVIAFYPGAYPSGTSESNYISFTSNFTVPSFMETTGSYLGFVISTFGYVNEYYNGMLLYSDVPVGFQIALDFAGPTYDYFVTGQVWVQQNSGEEIYYVVGLIGAEANTEATLSLQWDYQSSENVSAFGSFNDNNGATATIWFPKIFYHDGIEYVVQDTGCFGISSANPSFAIEGTYTGQPSFSNSGWDGLWVSGAMVQHIDAVAGYSGETEVGESAPIPSYYAESGLTLFHDHDPIINYWSDPYAWYFSIGVPSAYSSHNLNYVQLSEGQTKDTINGLNYALSWEQP